MRIGLYGMPCAGKTYLIKRVRNFEGICGSELLHKMEPDFQKLSDEQKKAARKNLAEKLMQKDNIIVDGHYMFGDKVVFTEQDGQLYDTFIYLYVEPSILKERMNDSIKNNKYLKFDIEKWQLEEIEALRKYCHDFDKDFYVIDGPDNRGIPDVDKCLDFVDSIYCGFSCKKFAEKCVKEVLENCNDTKIKLFDGDKTLTKQDTCGGLGYMTHIFDGNFYTGYQTWRHYYELNQFLREIDFMEDKILDLDIQFNSNVVDEVEKNNSIIVTTGCQSIWIYLAKKLNVACYGGDKVSADTKFFIAKYLKSSGKDVIAFGDSLNDYYMLKESNDGFLVLKEDGTVSRSLRDKDMEGLHFV